MKQEKYFAKHRVYGRVRDMREDSDMSQHQVAKILDVYPQQYHLYESGKREIPLHLLIRLADLYGVSLDYLTGRVTHRNESYVKSSTL